MKLGGLPMRMVRRVYHLLGIGELQGWLGQIRVSRSIPTVKERYVKDLNALRDRVSRKSGVVRVLFLISDTTKWKVQSVYDRMAASPMFEPFVAVNLYGWHESLSGAEVRAKEVMRFFEERNIPVCAAWDFTEHKPIPLNVLGADIVFYGQPWDVHPLHMPETVSHYALTCYVPYYVISINLSVTSCASPFQRGLFRYFIQSEDWAKRNRELGRGYSFAGEVVSTGHPMLDVFSKHDISRLSLDGPVIYAPHWTFPHKDNPNTMNLSTFLWTGRAMLDYARRHGEIQWAFKPHPTLKTMLIKSGVMSEDEVSAYYEDWARIGECCYSGDYAGLFMRSRAMITDCDSFLSEYVCTGRPLIRLRSPEDKTVQSPISERLFSTYYQVRTIEELEPVLDDLLVKGNDPNREARLAAAKAMNLTGTDAAGNIMRHLEELIFK